jgi:hypothetical protein
MHACIVYLQSAYGSRLFLASSLDGRQHYLGLEALLLARVAAEHVVIVLCSCLAPLAQCISRRVMAVATV